MQDLLPEDNDRLNRIQKLLDSIADADAGIAILYPELKAHRAKFYRNQSNSHMFNARHMLQLMYDCELASAKIRAKKEAAK